MNREDNIFIQDESHIKVLNDRYVAKANIYSEEQRQKIHELIRKITSHTIPLSERAMLPLNGGMWRNTRDV